MTFIFHGLIPSDRTQFICEKSSAGILILSAVSVVVIMHACDQLHSSSVSSQAVAKMFASEISYFFHTIV